MKEINLKKYKKHFKGYTELRLQENKQVNISFVNGSNKNNIQDSSAGVSARVNQNGAWGFASTPGTSRNDVKNIINEAQKNASFLARRKKTKKELNKKYNGRGDWDYSTAKPRLSQKELVQFMQKLDNHIEQKYTKLKSRSLFLNTLDMEKRLLTSESQVSYSLFPRSFIYVKLSNEKNGEKFEITDSFGGLGHFEDNFSEPADLYSEINELYNHLMKKREGVYAEAGSCECILDSELAGILAHEAFGHTVEADLVKSGSVAETYMNKKVAAPAVSMIDYANKAFGETCPVPVHVDDEGIQARDTVIIEDGILKSYMHNRETAREFDAEPTGHGRAFSFSDEPLIRMRNTAILPGEHTLSEMISSIEDGYYLIRPSNGQADSTSEFMFGIILGYEIKNGKLGRAIRDTTISGVAVDVLQSVSMISDDITWISSGMCGKKQSIPVGLGGPAVKCRVNLGGR